MPRKKKPNKAKDGEDDTGEAGDTDKGGSGGKNKSKKQRKYVCNVETCGKVFTAASYLRVHKAIHSDARTRVCPVEGCNKTFKTYGNLYAHKKLHKQKELQCTIEGCGKKFSTRAYLQEHYRSHSDARPFTCPEKDCGKTFKTRTVLCRHRVTHLPTKDVECTVEGCGRVFGSKRHLVTHVSRMHGEAKFDCTHPGCGKKFVSVSFLRSHETYHDETRSFLCTHPGCGAASKTKGDLKSHMMKHMADRPYKCPVPGCLKSYKFKQHLTEHAFSHSAELSFKCDREGCDKAFKNATRLRQHYWKYHSERTFFRCPVEGCTRDFLDEAKLASHQDMHKSLLKCHYKGCKETFTHYNARTYHMNKCHERKSYSCTFPGCSKVFFQLASLQVHTVTLHPNKEATHVCPMRKCRHSFFDEPTLKAHIETHTSKKGPHKCTVSECRETFVSAETLRYHLATIHPNRHIIRTFTCLECQAIFRSQHLLQSHEKLHKGNKEPLLTCSKPGCGKKFHFAPDQRRHRKTHYPIRVYEFKCPEPGCRKSFHRKSFLADHLILHMNKEAFKCDMCSKNYLSTLHLKRHKIMVHEGKRDYQCKICEFKFKAKIQLKNHVIRVHEQNYCHVCDIQGCESVFKTKKDLVMHKARRHLIMPPCGTLPKKLMAIYMRKMKLKELRDARRKAARTSGLTPESTSGSDNHSGSSPHRDSSGASEQATNGNHAGQEPSEKSNHDMQGRAIEGPTRTKTEQNRSDSDIYGGNALSNATASDHSGGRDEVQRSSSQSSSKKRRTAKNVKSSAVHGKVEPPVNDEDDRPVTKPSSHRQNKGSPNKTLHSEKETGEHTAESSKKSPNRPKRKDDLSRDNEKPSIIPSDCAPVEEKVIPVDLPASSSESHCDGFSLKIDIMQDSCKSSVEYTSGNLRAQKRTNSSSESSPGRHVDKSGRRRRVSGAGPSLDRLVKNLNIAPGTVAEVLKKTPCVLIKRLTPKTVNAYTPGNKERKNRTRTKASDVKSAQPAHDSHISGSAKTASKPSAPSCSNSPSISGLQKNSLPKTPPGRLKPVTCLESSQTQFQCPKKKQRIQKPFDISTVSHEHQVLLSELYKPMKLDSTKTSNFVTDCGQSYFKIESSNEANAFNAATDGKLVASDIREEMEARRHRTNEMEDPASENNVKETSNDNDASGQVHTDFEAKISDSIEFSASEDSSSRVVYEIVSLEEHNHQVSSSSKDESDFRGDPLEIPRMGRGATATAETSGEYHGSGDSPSSKSPKQHGGTSEISANEISSSEDQVTSTNSLNRDVTPPRVFSVEISSTRNQESSDEPSALTTISSSEISSTKQLATSPEITLKQTPTSSSGAAVSSEGRDLHSSPPCDSLAMYYSDISSPEPATEDEEPSAIRSPSSTPEESMEVKAEPGKTASSSPGRETSSVKVKPTEVVMEGRYFSYRTLESSYRRILLESRKEAERNKVRDSRSPGSQKSLNQGNTEPRKNLKDQERAGESVNKPTFPSSERPIKHEPEDLPMMTSTAVSATSEETTRERVEESLLEGGGKVGENDRDGGGDPEVAPPRKTLDEGKRQSRRKKKTTPKPQKVSDVLARISKFVKLSRSISWSGVTQGKGRKDAPTVPGPCADSEGEGLQAEKESSTLTREEEAGWGSDVVVVSVEPPTRVKREKPRQRGEAVTGGRRTRSTKAGTSAGQDRRPTATDVVGKKRRPRTVQPTKTAGRNSRALDKDVRGDGARVTRKRGREPTTEYDQASKGGPDPENTDADVMPIVRRKRQPRSTRSPRSEKRSVTMTNDNPGKASPMKKRGRSRMIKIEPSSDEERDDGNADTGRSVVVQNITQQCAIKTEPGSEDLQTGLQASPRKRKPSKRKWDQQDIDIDYSHRAKVILDNISKNPTALNVMLENNSVRISPNSGFPGEERNGVTLAQAESRDFVAETACSRHPGITRAEGRSTSEKIPRNLNFTDMDMNEGTPPTEKMRPKGYATRGQRNIRSAADDCVAHPANEESSLAVSKETGSATTQHKDGSHKELADHDECSPQITINLSCPSEFIETPSGDLANNETLTTDAVDRAESTNRDRSAKDAVARPHLRSAGKQTFSEPQTFIFRRQSSKKLAKYCNFAERSKISSRNNKPSSDMSNKSISIAARRKGVRDNPPRTKSHEKNSGKQSENDSTNRDELTNPQSNSADKISEVMSTPKKVCIMLQKCDSAISSPRGESVNVKTSDNKNTSRNNDANERKKWNNRTKGKKRSRMNLRKKFISRTARKQRRMEMRKALFVDHQSTSSSSLQDDEDDAASLTQSSEVKSEVDQAAVGPVRPVVYTDVDSSEVDLGPLKSDLDDIDRCSTSQGSEEVKEEDFRTAVFRSPVAPFGGRAPLVGTDIRLASSSAWSVDVESFVPVSSTTPRTAPDVLANRHRRLLSPLPPPDDFRVPKITATFSIRDQEEAAHDQPLDLSLKKATSEDDRNLIGHSNVIAVSQRKDPTTPSEACHSQLITDSDEEDTEVDAFKIEDDEPDCQVNTTVNLTGSGSQTASTSKCTGQCQCKTKRKVFHQIPGLA